MIETVILCRYSNGLIVCMPVELEGYIRPGCTILTVFISMPHLMWNKLWNDTVHYLHDFVKKPEFIFQEERMYIYISTTHSFKFCKMELHW
ncbi:hypothetical protein ZOSMA_123G00040 [Zostera marina]|uniref:Uncharacterized protein n=1 Tax=Zostera marina TaxID=29655 RepID=A0A0K9Q060_ZOSMR|nr:hypothetical protein ZOSMA_123G00040 [Zostera marina]